MHECIVFTTICLKMEFWRHLATLSLFVFLLPVFIFDFKFLFPCKNIYGECKNIQGNSMNMSESLFQKFMKNVRCLYDLNEKFNYEAYHS